MTFTTCNHCFALEHRVLIMGIVNVTPDSFSEDGTNFCHGDAIDAALAMVEAGADIIDVGGESTRPGAAAVDGDEQSRRVLPVIRELRRQSAVSISIDTCSADVAEVSLDHGADIINDISGFNRDPRMVNIAAKHRSGCIAMHMRGTPQTMQTMVDYADLIGDMLTYFRDVVARLEAAGVAESAICLDPGIGFSKTVDQNLILLNRLDAFLELGYPLLVGPSRKSFIGRTLGIDSPARREWGTAAACAVAVMRGAHILRVHDVSAMRQVCDLAVAIRAESSQTGR